MIAASLLIWFLFMTQAHAWGGDPYTYQPAYQDLAYSTSQPYRYTQPVYYSGYYTPAPFPSSVSADSNQSSSTDLSLKERAKQKIKTLPNSLNEKKQAFIEKLLPYIERENARIKQIRERASEIIRNLDSRYNNLSQESKNWLKEMGKKYRVDGNPVKDKEARKELLEKVDIIPASLTLAQAANESAWGKSRFATEANNLFGIWTYDESKGLIPKKRDDNKKHLVRKFDDMGESIGYYMHMLNSHPAYQKLREVRLEHRENNQKPGGHAMAAGLEKYSAKGDKYIELIRDLIRQNQWVLLDQSEQSV
jgi:Bax protein